MMVRRAKVLTLAATAAIALMYGSGIAIAGAVPGPIGALDSSKTNEGLVQQVRHGHHGHRGGGPMAFSVAGISGHHHHHHHRGRVFVGSGYYGYYAYDDDCWWSRRYHRWVCPYY